MTCARGLSASGRHLMVAQMAPEASNTRPNYVRDFRNGALELPTVIRDLGGGFKASYELRPDGSHEVRFFRYGRKIVANVFKPWREEEALHVFTGTTREQLLHSLKVVF